MNLELSPQDLLSTLKEFIVKAAKEWAEVEVIARSDWFTSKKWELILHLHFRNKTQKIFDQNGSVEAKTDLKIKRNNLRNAVRKAKHHWIHEYATKCTRTDFNSAPKKTWDIVFDIINQVQYKKSTKQFKGADRNTVTEEALNSSDIQEYYRKTFNQEVNVDKEEINKIPRKAFN